MKNKKVLLIDDNRSFYKLVARMLRDTEFQLDPTPVFDSIDGLKRFENNDYDIVLMDCGMPDLNNRQSDTAGFELLEVFLRRKPSIPVIMISGLNETLVEAIKRGARDYIKKDELDDKILLKKMAEQIYYQPLKKEIINILTSPEYKSKKIDKYDLLKNVKKKGVEIREFRNILDEMENKGELTLDSFFVYYNDKYIGDPQ